MDFKKYLIEHPKSRLIISYENEDKLWWAYMTEGKKVIFKFAVDDFLELLTRISKLLTRIDVRDK